MRVERPRQEDWCDVDDPNAWYHPRYRNRSRHLKDFLGDSQPSGAEAAAVAFHMWINGCRSFDWCYESGIVTFVREVGPGFRFASFLTSFYVVIIATLYAERPLLIEFDIHSPSTDMRFGDFTVCVAFYLWGIDLAIVALSYALCRIQGTRAQPRPVSAGDITPFFRVVTYELREEREAERRKNGGRSPWQMLVLFCTCLFYLTFYVLGVLCMHTILSHMYMRRNVWFAVLLGLVVLMGAISSIDDLTHIGSPWGIQECSKSASMMLSIRGCWLYWITVIWTAAAVAASFPPSQCVDCN